MSATDPALEVQQRLLRKTKPPGSLGRLEALAVDLARIQRSHRPRATPARIVLFAADHGVTARGISAYPPQVTRQMLANFAAGGAAVNVLARQAGAEVEVVNVGVAGCGTPVAGIVWTPLAAGTADLSRGPAMQADTCRQAMAIGAEAVSRALGAGCRVLALGEMGIGNTTAAAALLCALTGSAPEAAVGAGTGLRGRALGHKRTVVAEALRLHGPALADGFEALRRVGGLEIAALAGAMIAAEAADLPVLVDGFIVTVAALTAMRMAPACRRAMLFAHRSAERGHRLALKALGARPLLALGMRLGEGSGAAVALPLLRAACAILDDMASFESAGVSDALAR